MSGSPRGSKFQNPSSKPGSVSRAFKSPLPLHECERQKKPNPLFLFSESPPITITYKQKLQERKKERETKETKIPKFLYSKWKLKKKENEFKPVVIEFSTSLLIDRFLDSRNSIRFSQNLEIQIGGFGCLNLATDNQNRVRIQAIDSFIWKYR